MSENTSLSNAAPKGGGRQEMLLRVLCPAFLLIGSVLLWSDVVWPLLKTVEAMGWNQISCVIISSRLNTQSGLITTYSVDIVYSYGVLGKTYQTYQSNRYSFTDVSRFNEATAIVDRYPPGAKTPCYVNPSHDSIGLLTNPTDVVIEQCDFTVAFERVLGLRPLASFLCILFGIVGGLSIWSSCIARFIYPIWWVPVHILNMFLFMFYQALDWQCVYNISVSC